MKVLREFESHRFRQHLFQEQFLQVIEIA
ncbi:MAG: hypothetical protein RL350_1085, partial [Pseudomonadota bacterium]